MTLEELKAQYPYAEVVESPENSAEDAVYNYLSERSFDCWQTPDDGVILVVDPTLAYYVDTETLDAACFEPYEVGDWLLEQGVVDTGSTFIQLDEAGIKKFMDTAHETTWDGAVEAAKAYAIGSFEEFETPYGNVWQAIPAFWYSELASKVGAAAVEYTLEQ